MIDRRLLHMLWLYRPPHVLKLFTIVALIIVITIVTCVKFM